MWKKRSKKQFDTGLVLSGGGSRGFAHLGAFKAMQEFGIQPDIIAGVSAGSIAGALIANGKSPEESLHIIADHKLLDFLELTIPKTGLVRMSGFEKTMRKALSVKQFEELEIPLVVFAVNMNKARLTRFDKGQLLEAIMASASIPILFPAVEIEGEQYLDGGMINNFPVEELRGHCKTLIGVNVNPIGEVGTLINLKSVAERSFHITIHNQAVSKEDLCDLYIEPPGLDQYGLLDVSRAEEIYDMGYREARKKLKNFKN